MQKDLLISRTVTIIIHVLEQKRGDVFIQPIVFKSAKNVSNIVL